MLGQDRHHDLTSTVPIAGYVSWEVMHVLDPHYPLLSSSGTAYAAADGDALACRTSVERTEDEIGGM